MKGWNMTVKMKIIKNFIKGIDKIRSWLKKERRGFDKLFEKKKEEDLKKKEKRKNKGGENVIRQGSRKKAYTRDLEYILIC